MKAAASRPSISLISSRSSIAFGAPIGNAPALGSASPSAAASSRRWAERSKRPIAATAPARSSPSRCRWPRRAPSSRRRPGGSIMPSTPVPVLVVDDEPAIRRLLRTSLTAQGYRIVEAETAAAALAEIRDHEPDIVILDLGLPDSDGLDVIRAVRRSSPLPIVVLSSRGDERGKVEALDLGADDYLTKPFGMAELVARIRAALRHRLQAEGEEAVFQSGDLTVDLVRRIVRVRDNEAKLSPKEYDILRQLVMHAGKVLTHTHLLREVWGPATADVQYLRIYIRQLRQKLEADPERPRLIMTEAGEGYPLTAP